MSKKDKTPYAVVASAYGDDTVEFTVRARRSDLRFDSLSAVTVASNQIVSAEVIRPLQVGDKVRNKERASRMHKTRTVRMVIEHEGVPVIGFCSFKTEEDEFDPLDEHSDCSLIFAPAENYERVEE